MRIASPQRHALPLDIRILYNLKDNSFVKEMLQLVLRPQNMFRRLLQHLCRCSCGVRRCLHHLPRRRRRRLPQTTRRLRGCRFLIKLPVYIVPNPIRHHQYMVRQVEDGGCDEEGEEG